MTRYEKISEIANNFPVQQSGTRVLFCTLTAKTERLCEKMSDWKDRIHLILCQISGTCPEDGLFYSPAVFNPGNQEFVHDTVEKYYVDNGQSCPDTIDTIDEQIESNQQKINKCAANYVFWIRVILELLRKIRNSVLRIIYYGLSMVLTTIQLLAGALTGSANVLEDATARLMTYIGLLLESIMLIVAKLFMAVARLIFGGGAMEKIESIIRELCKLVNAFMQYFVIGFLCNVFFKSYQVALYIITSTLDACLGGTRPGDRKCSPEHPREWRPGRQR